MWPLTDKEKVDDHCKIAPQNFCVDQILSFSTWDVPQNHVFETPSVIGTLQGTSPTIVSPSYNFQDGYKSLQGTDEGNFPQDFFFFLRVYKIT